ncbi:MAG: hypothetical protein U0S36_13295 [Candidatus Nanopelagicales bacterium]
MRQTTLRRTALAGTAAGLSLALMVPLAGPASAHDSGRQGRHHSSDGWHEKGTSAESQARKALKAALKKARTDYRAAVRQANRTFFADPVVVDARADLKAVLRTSTDPVVILAAKQAYQAAIAGPLATRTAAVDAAATAYQTAVDAAYAVYDTATTTPEEAAARAKFRSDVRAARAGFTTARKAAFSDYRSATASAHATQRAAINAAIAAYLASDKGDQAKADFRAAVQAACTAFRTDPAVVAAKAELRSDLEAARTAYKAAIKAARDAFYAATGHNPWRGHKAFPRV